MQHKRTQFDRQPGLSPELARQLALLAGRQPLGRRVRRAAVRNAYRGGRTAVRKGWARRRPLAPVYTAVSLQAAAVASQSVPQADHTILALAALGAGGLILRGRRRRWNTRQWQYAGIVYGAGVTWLEVAAALGAGPPMPGLLGVGTLAAGIPWWWHHRVRHEPAAAPVDERLSRWGKIAGERGALPGSWLTDLVELSGEEQQLDGEYLLPELLAQTRGDADDIDQADADECSTQPAWWRRALGLAGVDTTEIDTGLVAPANWEATIWLPDGELTTDNAVNAATRIAGVYHLAPRSVVVEPTTNAEANMARLIVAERNPVNGITEYDASWAVLAGGCVPIGLFPDAATAWSRIWEPGSGPVHELFSGDSGAGKSRGMELSITQSAMTGRVVQWVGDPQGGQSMPAWAGIDGRADWIADSVDEIHRMLYAVRRIMYGRSRRLARMEWIDEDGVTRRGVDYFDPDVLGLPILEVTVDEAHAIFEEAHIVALVEEIAKMARKTGVRLRLGTQYPSVDQLGGSMAIRQQLVAGNVIAYRCSARVGGTMILPSWAPSPFEIPKTVPGGGHSKGVCVLDTSAPDSARATYLRTLWVRRAHHWADIAAGRMRELESEAVADAGEDYRTWRQRRAEALEVSLDDVPDGQSTAPADVTASGPAKPTAVPQPTGEEPDYADMPTGDAILACLRLRGGAVPTGVIADTIDRSLGATSMGLNRLSTRGLVISAGRGLWVATPDGIRKSA